MKLNQEITKLLKNEGCGIFGFADLQILPQSARQGFDTGIVMGVPYTAVGMKENLEGNSVKFDNDSGATLEPLEKFEKSLARFLKEKGYIASTSYKKTAFSGGISHKMVGTLSGIGWIGRCAILTTKKYGPALRLTAVLTNAPLKCGTPVTKSQCPPKCNACADICPTKAIKEGQWKQGVHRDTFFDVKACGKGRKKRQPMCGLCISICPFAKKGLGYE
jgi:epoxyqueuosine reductase QueG